MLKSSEYFQNWVTLHDCSQNNKTFYQSKQEYQVGRKTALRSLQVSLFEAKTSERGKNGTSMDDIFRKSRFGHLCTVLVLTVHLSVKNLKIRRNVKNML